MNAIGLQTLPSGRAAAMRLSTRLGIACDEICLHHFPDGELRVTTGAATTTTIIYASLDEPNEKLIALLLAAEALRRGGAKRLVLVAPYLCYMRQDAAFHSGEAISQRAIGRLLATIVDRVITVDAHLHRTRDIAAVFPRIEADNLSAMPAIASALARTDVDRAAIVVGPDAESEAWIGDLAGRLGLPHAVGHKTRYGDRSVRIEFVDSGLISGRPVLLVDDIVSSGATMAIAGKALKAAGATDIEAIVTHALFPAETARTFANAGIRSVRSTDSVPHPTNAFALDDILAASLRRELGPPKETTT